LIKEIMLMKTTMILAKDILTSVIEGDADMMACLRNQTREYELVVLLSCVTEGLELANPATPLGLRSLAALIAMSRFQIPQRGGIVDGAEHGTDIRLTTDVLLSCLLGKIESSTIGHMKKDLPVIINDALLVAALLSVSDKDELHPANLAAVLKITTMHLVDVPDTDRVCWPEQFGTEAITRLRDKALMETRANS
jgi:hypothetical protein